MSITIKEVLTKKDLVHWVEFPNKLYRNNEFFVPFVREDEIDTFTKEKNPSYAFCETRLFLAYRDGEIVGRMAILAEGDARDRDDIQYLEPLPLFRADGTVL